MTSARALADEVMEGLPTPPTFEGKAFDWRIFPEAVKFRDRIEVAILAHEAAGWRPISEAPRDGTKVLLWCPSLNNCIQAQWRVHDLGGEWVDIWNNDPIEDMSGVAEPTHFRLRPPPPEPEVKP